MRSRGRAGRATGQVRVNPMDKRDTFWSRGHGERPKVFAHRGNTGEAFENTLSAYMKAVETGADGIEIDVSATKDGKLICFHDATLKRISGSGQAIRETSYRTLRSIPLEGNERIPTLAEAFDAIPSSMAVILDVKTRGVFDAGMIEALLKLLKKISFEGPRQIAVTSFNYLALKVLSGKSPDLRLGFILRPDSVHAKLGMARPLSRTYRAVHPHLGMVSRKHIEAWNKAGLDVIPWTVNERSDIMKLAADGVDGIITDDPRMVLDALKP
jgi:glycerophosphoryl diester phosphodiesterase